MRPFVLRRLRSSPHVTASTPRVRDIAIHRDGATVHEPLASLVYTEVLADERGTTAAGFLARALAWFAARDVAVRRVCSDNGSCYRSEVHRGAVTAQALTHGFTQSYRPLPAADEPQGRALHPDAAHREAYAQAYRTAAWRASYNSYDRLPR